MRIGADNQVPANLKVDPWLMAKSRITLACSAHVTPMRSTSLMAMGAVISFDRTRTLMNSPGKTFFLICVCGNDFSMMVAESTS